MLDTLIQDVRYALRSLRRSPGFTAAAIITLALGIGASTAVFSVVNGVLLRPLPFVDAGRLVALHRPGDVEADVSLPDAQDWRAASHELSHLALYNAGWAFDLTGDGEPEQLNGSVVEPAYFSVLGTLPLAGRAFTDVDGRAPVAVISEGLWHRRFGKDPGAIGRTLTLSDVTYTIVGVMPASFDWLGAHIDLWVPIASAMPWALAERGTNNFEVIGRLAPGATLEGARAEMLALSTRLASAYPRSNGGKVMTVTPLLDYLTGSVRQALIVFLGAVGLVLLIACANLSNLLLTRAHARRHEFGVRLALGAEGGRLVRQLLTESLLIAFIGGAVGAVIALWGTDLLLGVVPGSLPRADTVRVDGRVFGVAAALAVTTGLFFGLVPALWARRQPAARAIAAPGSSSGADPRRLLDGVVTAEAALAFVLLAGAGLLLRTFVNLRHVDIGVDPSHVLSARLVLPESRYGTPAPQTRAITGIVDALRAVPGVEHAAFVVGGPLDPSTAIGHTVRLADRPVPPDSLRRGARSRPVAGDYFATVRLPIMQGRAIDATDRADGLAVAVVNERLARRYWPGGGAVGQRIAWDNDGSPLRWMTIVGVTRDVPFGSVTDGDADAIYFPYVQREDTWIRFGTLLIRTRGEPAVLERQMREAAWSVDPTLVLTQVQPLEAARTAAMASQQLSARLAGAFAAAAVLIAAEGIYAVLAFRVARRRREIGVRVALGARPDVVARMVLRQGAARAAAGILIGAVGALASGRALQRLLFGVLPTDPFTFTLGAATLLAVALLASWLPARRAAAVDPMIALRDE